MPGVAVSAQLRPFDDLQGLEASRGALDEALPEDVSDILGWAPDLSRERLLGVLAVLVASAVDLTHEDASPADLARQAIADQLSRHLDIDMRAFWAPGIDFWVRLSKSALLTAMQEAPGMSERSRHGRDEAIKAFAKLRKDELAVKVCAAFDGAGYLPDILVTPALTGDFDVTDEGAAAASCIAAAAE